MRDVNSNLVFGFFFYCYGVFMIFILFSCNFNYKNIVWTCYWHGNIQQIVAGLAQKKHVFLKITVWF